mgnify:CR=1 FL=1
MREDWVKCRFEDLLNYEQPTNYIVNSTEYDDSYETPVLTAGKSFIKGYTNEKDGVFNNLPTIIFDDFTTASQFVNFKFKVKSSAMKILVPTSDLINTKFVYYAMQVNKVRSDTHKRYWISIYSKKEIFIPSVNEQSAIVAKIEEFFSDLDKGEEDLKKAQEQLKVYRQAVLKKAFDGEWEKLSLSELGTWGSGGTPSRANPDYFKGSIPWVKTGELGSKYITTAEEKITEQAIKNSSAKLFPSNSVAIAMYGATIGKTSIFKAPLSTNQACAVVQPNDSIDTEYLYYLLTSMKRKFISLGKGGAQPNISQTLIKQQVVPLPDLDSQKEIVQEIESRLSVCDSIEASIRESLDKSKALRQSILRKAFEGTLLSAEEISACKAAPDYEPASVLLERIKTEKKKK